MKGDRRCMICNVWPCRCEPRPVQLPRPEKEPESYSCDQVDRILEAAARAGYEAIVSLRHQTIAAPSWLMQSEDFKVIFRGYAALSFDVTDRCAADPTFGPERIPEMHAEFRKRSTETFAAPLGSEIEDEVFVEVCATMRHALDRATRHA